MSPRIDWPGAINVEQKISPVVLDSSVADGPARRIYESITRALDHGFEELGIETVVEDTFGVIALRIVDSSHVGTAYLELRDGGLRLRIVLVDESADS